MQQDTFMAKQDTFMSVVEKEYCAAYCLAKQIIDNLNVTKKDRHFSFLFNINGGNKITVNLMHEDSEFAIEYSCDKILNVYVWYFKKNNINIKSMTCLMVHELTHYLQDLQNMIHGEYDDNMTWFNYFYMNEEKEAIMESAKFISLVEKDICDEEVISMVLGRSVEDLSPKEYCTVFDDYLAEFKRIKHEKKYNFSLL